MVDGMQLVEQAVTLTFPESFGVPELRGVTVAATVFAVRPRTEYPLWCDYKHPADGRWRSVFVQRAWTAGLGADFNVASERTAKRAFKRPR